MSLGGVFKGPWCGAPGGCPNRHVSRSLYCFEHDQSDETGKDRSGPARMTPMRPLDFSVICLCCGDRREAHGTEDDANHTRKHLGSCARCAGPLVVERSDLGGISSPITALPVKFGRVG